VIALSVHDEPSVRSAAISAGADAFVLKRAIATELLAAVDLVSGAAARPKKPPSPPVR
jgi:two-component system secretion response regulator SsrB